MRVFPHGDCEAIYKSGFAPSEVERFNEWLADAGVDNRVRSLGPAPVLTEAEREARRQQQETNEERAARRAKQAVRWKVKAIGADRMLIEAGGPNERLDDVLDPAVDGGHLRAQLA